MRITAEADRHRAPQLAALGSKEAGPKIAAIFSIVKSCRKLGASIRQYLAEVLPGLADRSIHELAGLTPSAYAANMAK